MQGRIPSEPVELNRLNGIWLLTLDDQRIKPQDEIQVRIVNSPKPRKYYLQKTKRNNYKMS